MRHDMNDVFFACRGVNVVLRELIRAHRIGRFPHALVPSEKLVAKTFPVSWHVLQHDDGFKPVKFVHQIYDECP